MTSNICQRNVKRYPTNSQEEWKDGIMLPEGWRLTLLLQGGKTNLEGMQRQSFSCVLVLQMKCVVPNWYMIMWMDIYQNMRDRRSTKVLVGENSSLVEFTTSLAEWGTLCCSLAGFWDEFQVRQEACHCVDDDIQAVWIDTGKKYYDSRAGS